jgi:hypothetical protein
MREMEKLATAQKGFTNAQHVDAFNFFPRRAPSHSVIPTEGGILARRGICFKRLTRIASPFTPINLAALLCFTPAPSS